MRTTFLHSLRRYTGQIIGWGVGLALVGAYSMLLFDTLVKPGVQQQFEQLLSSYPPELMAFFGDVSKMLTPAGYVDTLFFSYIPIIVCIFAILACANLLVGDEEKGILDLVLAHPVTRGMLFWSRLYAFCIAVILILAIAWLGFVIPLPRTSFEATPLELLLPFVSLFALMLFIGTLTLMLSLILPSLTWAAMLSGLILVASYFLTSLSRLSEDLKPIERFFPMHYYQGGQAMSQMDWAWFGILVGFSVLFSWIALWLFERRDIRVSGERGWGAAGLLDRRHKQAKVQD
jgi:ABC-2 type transport system permease protein